MNNNFLIGAAIISWGIGAVFYKLANNHVHPIMTSAVMVGLYMVLLPIAFLLFKIDFTISTVGFWFSLLGGLCMCIGTISYMFALRQGGAGEIAALTSIYPVVTLFISILFLGEGFSIKKLIGCSFAVLSVFLLTLK